MYGPGTGAPPPRLAPRGAAIALRVLFTVLPFVTMGVAAWGSVLRLALLRRRTMDWAMLPVTAVLGIGGFVLTGSSPEDSTQSNVGVVGIFLCMLGVPVYYLVADLVWHSSVRTQQRQVFAGSANPYATGPLQGPLVGQMTGPVVGAPHGPIPGPIPGPPAHGVTGHSPYSSTPPAQPPAHGPAHPRMDQVRAELDELSDYLRKEDGR